MSDPVPTWSSDQRTDDDPEVLRVAHRPPWRIAVLGACVVVVVIILLALLIGGGDDDASAPQICPGVGLDSPTFATRAELLDWWWDEGGAAETLAASTRPPRRTDPATGEAIAVTTTTPRRQDLVLGDDGALRWDWGDGTTIIGIEATEDGVRPSGATVC